MTAQETAETAIRVLQSVISTDFKSNEIEVGFSSVDQPKFRKLTEEEIESILNVIAEAN